MKKLLLIIALVIASISLNAQNPNVNRRTVNFDAATVMTVQTKTTNLNLAFGGFLGITNSNGIGAATMITFGSQSKINSYDYNMEYWNLVAGYYQDIFDAKFSLGVLGGTTITTATDYGRRYSETYTYPILYTILNWHTKATGLDIGAVAGVGFLNSRNKPAEPSNFPLTLGLTLGWDL